MAFSYSFHLSSKGHSVSNKSKVSQVSKHNLREYKSASYDRSQIEILRGSQSILEDMAALYHREFDDVLERYNSRQKRIDRRIDDYFEHVSRSRGDVGAEIIIQIGDRDFWKSKSLAEKKKMSYIFQDQVRSLEQLCPSFKVVSAVVHYDESSPHMHIVGVPVASGYKKGMEKQVAKTKVFTKDSLAMLQNEMRRRAEKGLKLNLGLFQDVHLKAKEKGRNKDIPKYSLEIFYENQKELANQSETLDQQAEQIREQQKNLVEASQKLVEAKNQLEPYKTKVIEFEAKIGRLEAIIQHNRELIEKQRVEFETTKDELKELEPLRTEISELKRSKAILCGEVENELKQAKFEAVTGTKKMFALREQGKLLALYKDGHTRSVGTNEHGGLDNQTLDDRKAGKCVVGTYREESYVKVPESLFKELIQSIDKSLSISDRLKDFINQFEQMKKTIQKHILRGR